MAKEQTNEQDAPVKKAKVYKEKDFVSYKEKSDKFFKGTVTAVEQENGKEWITIQNKSQGSIKVENTNAIKPLFFENSNNKRVPLRYDEREVAVLMAIERKLDAEGKKKDVFGGLRMDDFAKQKTKVQLLQGKRTGLMKGIKWKKDLAPGQDPGSQQIFDIEGKFQLGYNKYGLTVNFESKLKELSVKDVYAGKTWTKEEKQKLENGESLGLVKDLANKQTGELYNAWVSVDTELNRIIQVPENRINISRLFDKDLTKKQQQDLQEGKHIIVSYKKDKVYMKVNPSSVYANENGIVRMPEEAAKKFGVLKEAEKKNEKAADQGISM